MKNKTIVQTSFFLLLFVASSFFSPRLSAQCDPVSDSLALVALYHATGGDNWVDNSNWLVEGQGIETWSEVAVNGDGCVTGLYFYSNGLVGNIPYEVGDLLHLKQLVFSENGITGNIPLEIATLPNLTHLVLEGNNFSGNIIPETGNLSHLQQLNIRGTGFIGSIPAELGNLTNLLWLTINATNIQGEIPSTVGNLTNLTRLNLENNHQLTGSIPAEIGNLSNLTRLNLENNSQLTGSIPPEIGNLTNLEVLHLDKNQLTGSIPPEIGNLANLETLYLDENQLTGSIPSEIGNLGNLATLDFNRNELTGNIPAEIGNLANLKTLDLNRNELTGNIPAEIGNLSNLTNLSIGENELTGSLPPEIGNLSNLITLYLPDNQLTAIPPEIGNLSSLVTLNLAKNQLTTAPPEIGNLSNLTGLHLNHNNLSGSIFPEIGNLPAIQAIYLNNNQLTGNIPPEIGNLSTLTLLYLSDNQLTNLPLEIGNLPAVFILNIENNNLEGNIPVEIGNMLNLRVLSLYNNNLSGSIPSEIGNITNLVRLELNDNQLTGKLPIELSNLAGLQIISLANNQLYGCFPPQYSTFCSTDSTSFSGNLGLPNGGDFDAFCESGSGACNPTTIGKITFDENQNCAADTLEVGLQQWMVKARSPSGDLYGISDTSGHYSIYTYPEEYLVELIPPGPYWEENCAGVVFTDIIDSLDLDTINFFPNILVECPFMTVDISTPFLRRCFANTYVVNYCNSGTALAEGASIIVQFDELINIDSASIAISEEIDNVLTFELGNVATNECGSFFIYTNVSCDSELEQALCATAHIYPDSICAEISPEWSGATVEVDGTCEGDEVSFIIKNTGIGDMQQNETYIVIEDGLILFAEPVPFILNSDGDLEVNFPANGSTYICQAMQVNNHPVPSMPTAFVEGCGTNADGDFSTGYITQFPEDDNAPFVSIDCQEVIGSFDPNDKNSYPKGYGDEHFIEKGQDIEYHIRFQNTGTDTAFTVVVEDVISPNLEMTSLRLGASSHPYSIEIFGSDTLKFTFNNILLPDSTANESASHGFLKFKISPKADLDKGTVIENQAAIFFDFNDAVLTNSTLHTIGENFVQTETTNEAFISNLKVSLAPNPVVNEAIIHISGIEFKNAQLSLFNTLGVLLREEAFNGNDFLLKKGDLPAGIYLFEIKVDGRKGFAGKMMVK